MSETIEQAPRLEHNSKLSQEFITKLAVKGRYPKVLDQAASLPLELTKLVRFSYNNSIIRDEGCMIMAYRYHDGNTLATRLAIAQVGFDGKVLSNRTLEFPDGGTSVEDPKLFHYKDSIWFSWVESSWPRHPITSVVRYGKLEGNKPVLIQQVEPIKPKVMEKNHVLFSIGSSLFCIYESEPEQLIYELKDGKVVSEHRSPSPTWAYGPVRGGTPPIQYRGKLLRLFHSGVDNEFQGWRRRYFMGALLMDPEPPFKVTAMSKKPLLYGSEISDLPVSSRPPHFKPRVVFPGGCVQHGNTLLVAAGVNDSEVAILKFDDSRIGL